MKCPIVSVSVRTAESRPARRLVGQTLSLRWARARPEDPLHRAGARLHCETSGRGRVHNLRRVQLLGQIETNHWVVSGVWVSRLERFVF